MLDHIVSVTIIDRLVNRQYEIFFILDSIIYNIILAIAMIGDYKSKKPPRKAINALESLIQCGISYGHVKFYYTVVGKQYYLT